MMSSSTQQSLLRIAGITIVLMLQACALKIANFVTPSSGYDEVSTLTYGDSERQTINLYQPAEAPLKPLVLIFFYGGAWEEGKKEDYRFVAQRFTQQGYRIAIPDYRLYPEVTFPRFVEDGAAAVALIAKQFPDSPLVLMGHSAGAQIAALLALDDHYLGHRGLDQQRIRALVGWSGPYDFLPLTSKTLEAIFTEEQRAASQPINFVDAKAPPTLLIHGLGDTRVKPGNSKHLAEKLRQFKVPVKTHFYEDVEHVETVGSLVSFLSGWSSTLPDTLEFLEKL